MTREEAEIAAYKRVRTEKIIAATAALTVTAAAVYVAKKQYDKSVDKVIKQGTTLQRISRDNNVGVSDAFYASMTRSDNTKYRGMYGRAIQTDRQGPFDLFGKRDRNRAVFEKKIDVTKDIKMASEKSAVKVLQELVKDDPSYATTLKKHLSSSTSNITEGQKRAIKKGLQSLNSGKIDKHVYEALNLTLVDHELSTSKEINSKFYGRLMSKGYDAIMDINDKKLSGYMADKPIIVFNGSGRTKVNHIRRVGAEEIDKAARKGEMNILVKTLAPQYAGIAAATAGAVGTMNATTRIAQNKTNDKIVSEYKKEHPNTDLSYTEIVRNYRRNK